MKLKDMVKISEPKDFYVEYENEIFKLGLFDVFQDKIVLHLFWNGSEKCAEFMGVVVMQNLIENEEGEVYLRILDEVYEVESIDESGKVALGEIVENALAQNTISKEEDSVRFVKVIWFIGNEMKESKLIPIEKILNINYRKITESVNIQSVFGDTKVNKDSVVDQISTLISKEYLFRDRSLLSILEDEEAHIYSIKLLSGPNEVVENLKLTGKISKKENQNIFIDEAGDLCIKCKDYNGSHKDLISPIPFEEEDGDFTRNYHFARAVSSLDYSEKVFQNKDWKNIRN